MVHLIPPDAETATEASPTAAAATAAAAAVAPRDVPDFAAVADLGQSLDAPLPPAPAAAPESATNPAAEPTATPAEEASPFVVTPAESTSRWVGAVIVGGGVSLFAVTGLMFWLTRSGETPDPAPVASAAAPAAVTPVADPMADSLAPLVDEAAAVEEAPTVEPIAIDPPGENLLDEPVAVLPPDEPEPVEPPSIAEAPVESPVEQPIAAPAEPAPVVAEEPPTVQPFDPLDFDPASLDLILTRRPKQAAAPAEPAPAAPDPDNDLDARLAARAGEVGPGPDLDQQLEALAQDARAVVRRGPTGPPRAALVDPLATVIPEIQLANAPLDRLCRLLADVAGAPVTIDPAGLRYAAVAANRRVSVRGVGQPIGDLFDQVLTPLRLEVADEGRGLVVSRGGATRAKQGAYRVDDLTDGRGNAAALAQMFNRLLPDTRAAITADDGRIVVDGPASAHMDVAILCERLRKAQGLAARSRYPTELLAATPSLQTLDSVLSRRTTFSFVEYTPLAEVIDYWRRASGLVILVDWAALADAQFHPGSTLACSVVDRPWDESLDAVLGGIGLAWRVIDGRTLQITTLNGADRGRIVEFYRLADKRLTAIEQILAEEEGATMVADEPSRSLILSGSTKTHRAAWKLLGN